jgi:hypothetical protein
LRYDNHQKLEVFFLQSSGKGQRAIDMVTIAIADNGDDILKGRDFFYKNVSTILSQCDPL